MSKKTISYLPFARISEKYEIMNTYIVPYEEIRDELKAYEPYVLYKLDSYFSSFHDSHGNPLKNIPIVYYEKFDISNESVMHIDTIIKNLKIIFLIQLFEKIRGCFQIEYWNESLPSSDSFLLHSFSFSDDKPEYSISYPNNTSMLGAEIGKTKRYVQSYLLQETVSVNSLQKKVYATLNYSIKDYFPFIRFLDAIFAAHLTGNSQNIFVKHILLCTCFEVITGISGAKKRLCEYMNNVQPCYNFSLDWTKYTDIENKNGKKILKLNPVANWTWEFFLRRNSIVHEYKLDKQALPENGNIPYYFIAIVILMNLISHKYGVQEAILNLKPEITDSHEFDILKSIWLEYFDFSKIYQKMNWIL